MERVKSNKKAKKKSGSKKKGGGDVLADIDDLLGDGEPESGGSRKKKPGSRSSHQKKSSRGTRPAKSSKRPPKKEFDLGDDFDLDGLDDVGTDGNPKEFDLGNLGDNFDLDGLDDVAIDGNLKVSNKAAAGAMKEAANFDVDAFLANLDDDDDGLTKKVQEEALTVQKDEVQGKSPTVRKEETPKPTEKPLKPPFYNLVMERLKEGEEAAIVVAHQLPAEALAKAQDPASGRSLLHEACANGFAELAEVLIEKGVDVQGKCSEGKTPADYAVAHKGTKLVEVLERAGADMSALKKQKSLTSDEVEPDKKEGESHKEPRTATNTGPPEPVTAEDTKEEEAKPSGPPEVTDDEIESRFRTIVEKIKQGEEEAMVAIREVSHEKLFVAKDDATERTLLHTCCLNGFGKLAVFLIENKADVNFKCADGKTALDYLLENGHRSNGQLLQVLESAGADMSALRVLEQKEAEEAEKKRQLPAPAWANDNKGIRLARIIEKKIPEILKDLMSEKGVFVGSFLHSLVTKKGHGSLHSLQNTKTKENSKEEDSLEEKESKSNEGSDPEEFEIQGVQDLLKQNRDIELDKEALWMLAVRFSKMWSAVQEAAMKIKEDWIRYGDESKAILNDFGKGQYNLSSKISLLSLMEFCLREELKVEIAEHELKENLGVRIPQMVQHFNEFEKQMKGSLKSSTQKLAPTFRFKRANLQLQNVGCDHLMHILKNTKTAIDKRTIKTIIQRIPGYSDGSKSVPIKDFIRYVRKKQFQSLLSEGDEEGSALEKLLRMLFLKNQDEGVHDIFASIDVDRSGKITPEEFQKLLQSAKINVPQNVIYALLDRLDTDKDGHINVKELSDFVAPRRFWLSVMTPYGQTPVRVPPSAHLPHLKWLVGKFIFKWRSRLNTTDRPSAGAAPDRRTDQRRRLLENHFLLAQHYGTVIVEETEEVLSKPLHELFRCGEILFAMDPEDAKKKRFEYSVPRQRRIKTWEKELENERHKKRLEEYKEKRMLLSVQGDPLYMAKQTKPKRYIGAGKQDMGGEVQYEPNVPDDLKEVELGLKDRRTLISEDDFLQGRPSIALRKTSKHNKELLRRGRAKKILPNELLNWSVEQVANWLQYEVELPVHAPCFRSNKINGMKLLLLTDEALEECGISQHLHRKKIIKWKDKLTSECFALGPDPPERVMQWTVADVATWLVRDMQLPLLCPLFWRGRVDGLLILALEPALMREMQLSEKDIKKIWPALKKMRRAEGLPISVVPPLPLKTELHESHWSQEQEEYPSIPPETPCDTSKTLEDEAGREYDGFQSESINGMKLADEAVHSEPMETCFTEESSHSEGIDLLPSIEGEDKAQYGLRAYAATRGLAVLMDTIDQPVEMPGLSVERLEERLAIQDLGASEAQQQPLDGDVNGLNNATLQEPREEHDQDEDPSIAPEIEFPYETSSIPEDEEDSTNGMKLADKLARSEPAHTISIEGSQVSSHSEGIDVLSSIEGEDKAQFSLRAYTATRGLVLMDTMNQAVETPRLAEEHLEGQLSVQDIEAPETQQQQLVGSDDVLNDATLQKRGKDHGNNLHMEPQDGERPLHEASPNFLHTINFLEEIESGTADELFQAFLPPNKLHVSHNSTLSETIGIISKAIQRTGTEMIQNFRSIKSLLSEQELFNAPPHTLGLNQCVKFARNWMSKNNHASISDKLKGEAYLGALVFAAFSRNAEKKLESPRYNRVGALTLNSPLLRSSLDLSTGTSFSVKTHPADAPLQASNTINRLQFEQGLRQLLGIELTWVQLDSILKLLDTHKNQEINASAFITLFTQPVTNRIPQPSNNHQMDLPRKGPLQLFLDFSFHFHRARTSVTDLQDRHNTNRTRVISHDAFLKLLLQGGQKTLAQDDCNRLFKLLQQLKSFPPEQADQLKWSSLIGALLEISFLRRVGLKWALNRSSHRKRIWVRKAASKMDSNFIRLFGDQNGTLPKTIRTLLRELDTLELQAQAEKLLMSLKIASPGQDVIPFLEEVVAAEQAEYQDSGLSSSGPKRGSPSPLTRCRNLHPWQYSASKDVRLDDRFNFNKQAEQEKTLEDCILHLTSLKTEREQWLAALEPHVFDAKYKLKVKEKGKALAFDIQKKLQSSSTDKYPELEKLMRRVNNIDHTIRSQSNLDQNQNNWNLERLENVDGTETMDSLLGFIHQMENDIVKISSQISLSCRFIMISKIDYPNS